MDSHGPVPLCKILYSGTSAIMSADSPSGISLIEHVHASAIASTAGFAVVDAVNCVSTDALTQCEIGA